MIRAGWLVAAAICLALCAAHANPARAQLAAPDAVQAEFMVKNTLAALNHANLTGNYTVLRDLGSLRFRASNTAARLGEVFARLREQNIDLSPIVVLEPQFVVPPSLDEAGRLRLAGQFPSRPLRVVFDIAYELGGNRWALSDLSVNAVPWPEEQPGQAEDGEEQGSTSGIAPPDPAGRQDQLPIPQRRPVQQPSP